MLRRYITREKALAPPIPQFDHDPNFIIFRSWTAILSWEGILPEENPADSHFLFLDENADACGSERVPVRGPICLRNLTRLTHLNVAIVCAWSGQEVFFVRELPAGISRFLPPSVPYQPLCRTSTFALNPKDGLNIAVNLEPVQELAASLGFHVLSGNDS